MNVMLLEVSPSYNHHEMRTWEMEAILAPFSKWPWNYVVIDIWKVFCFLLKYLIIFIYSHDLGGWASLIDGFWNGWLDLLIRYTEYSGLQAIQLYRQSPHFTVHCCKHTRVLSLHSPLVISWQRIHKSHYHFKSRMKSFLHRVILFFPSSQLFSKMPLPETRLISSLLLSSS
jgi:hypothetical protein